MPAFGAVQTPTTLSSGEKLAVLNAENLASGSATMAVATTPQPMPITLGILNNAGQSVTLQASADNKADGSTYFPVYNEAGNEVTVAASTVGVAVVPGGLFYRLLAGGAITVGTIWLAR